MAREPAPAFQFYPRDFVGDLDVAALTLEQIGGYTLLLCYAWLKDGLPNDPAKLAKALRVTPVKFAAVWAVVGEKFPQADDGRLRNPRQEQERAKQQDHRAASSEHGKRGARARWEPLPEPCPGNARAMPADSSSSASAFAPSEDPPTPSGVDDPLSAAAESAAWVCAQFPDWYAQERNGARAPRMGPLDWSIAKSLCEDWPDRAHLEGMIRLFLRAEKIVSAHSDRSLRIFAKSYASGCDAALRRQA